MLTQCDLMRTSALTDYTIFLISIPYMYDILSLMFPNWLMATVVRNKFLTDWCIYLGKEINS